MMEFSMVVWLSISEEQRKKNKTKKKHIQLELVLKCNAFKSANTVLCIFFFLFHFPWSEFSLFWMTVCSLICLLGSSIVCFIWLLTCLTLAMRASPLEWCN